MRRRKVTTPGLRDSPGRGRGLRDSPGRGHWTLRLSPLSSGRRKTSSSSSFRDCSEFLFNQKHEHVVSLIHFGTLVSKGCLLPSRLCNMRLGLIINLEGGSSWRTVRAGGFIEHLQGEVESDSLQWEWWVGGSGSCTVHSGVGMCWYKGMTVDWQHETKHYTWAARIPAADSSRWLKVSSSPPAPASAAPSNPSDVSVSLKENQ